MTQHNEKLDNLESLTKVLISPRVDMIPNPRLLTLAVSLFILLFSSSAVFLFPVLLNNEEKVTLLFPIQEDVSGLTCNSVRLLANEGETIQSISDTVVRNILFNRVILEIFKPEEFLIESMSLTNIQIVEFVKMMEVLIATGSVSFVELSNLPFIELIDENQVKVLTESVSCSLQLVNTKNIASICNQSSIFEADIIVDAELDPTAAILSYFFNYHIPSEKWNELGGIFSPSRLDELNELPRLLSILDKATTNSNVYCRRIVSGNFFTDFGLYTGFGFLFEGFISFLFASTIFSGIIGLKKHPYQAESPFIANKNLGNLLPIDEMKEIEKNENEEEQNALPVNQEFSLKAMKRIFKGKGRNLIRMKDIKRVVHNPRCEFLKHAGLVSLLSSIVFFLVTATIAFVFQWNDEIKTCSSVKFDELASHLETDECQTFGFSEAIPLNVEESSRRTEFDFGVYLPEVFLNINSFDQMNSTHNPLFNAEFVENLENVCVDVFNDVDNPVIPSCLDSLEGFNLTNRDEFDFLLDATYVETANERGLTSIGSFTERYDINLSNGITGKASIFYNFIFAKLSISISHDQLNFKAGATIHAGIFEDILLFPPPIPYYLSDEGLYTQVSRRLQGFPPFMQNTMIRSFLKNVVFEPTQMFSKVAETSITCCRKEPQFNYFEYFGIALAYVVFLEGFLVLFVARFFYCCVDRE